MGKVTGLSGMTADPSLLAHPRASGMGQYGVGATGQGLCNIHEDGQQ